MRTRPSQRITRSLIIVDASIRHSRAKYLHTALVSAIGAIGAAQPLAAALAPMPQADGEQPAGVGQLPLHHVAR